MPPAKRASTRIVSSTVTEKGYSQNIATGDLDFENESVKADLADGLESPSTAVGLIVGGLEKRRKAGLPGLTVLCCDNLQANGDMTRRVVLQLAGAFSAETKDWIEKNVTFPNSMVDRITPMKDPAYVEYMRKEFGVLEQGPVMSEDFIQWIVEDKFAEGRPPLEREGVRFVEDVMPYELTKLRILNGAH